MGRGPSMEPSWHPGHSFIQPPQPRVIYEHVHWHPAQGSVWASRHQGACFLSIGQAQEILLTWRPNELGTICWHNSSNHTKDSQCNCIGKPMQASQRKRSIKWHVQVLDLISTIKTKWMKDLNTLLNIPNILILYFLLASRRDGIDLASKTRIVCCVTQEYSEHFLWAFPQRRKFWNKCPCFPWVKNTAVCTKQAV